MSRTIDIRVEGINKAIADLEATERRKRGRVVRAVAVTAMTGEAGIKKFLTNPSPSRPGQPPGVDTGRYRASWRHDIHSFGFGADLSTDVVYGPFLEYGTSRMAARPHAGPYSEQLKKVWIANAKEALRD